MSVARAGERPQTWYRSERVFASNSKWYFRTREGVDVGPYESQFEAEIEAAMLKELLLGRLEAETARSVIREFVLESYVMGRPLAPTIFERHAAPSSMMGSAG